VLWREFDKNPLMVADWPKLDSAVEPKEMIELQDLVTAIRDQRASYKAEPKQELRANIRGFGSKYFSEQLWIERLTNTKISLAAPVDTEKLARTVSRGFEIYVDVAGGADTAREKERLQKDAANLEKYAASIEAKLNNPEFVSKAPEAVIGKEKAKLAAAKEELQKIRDQLKLVQ
jgi:valyl-tRNA synthetase